MKMRVLQWATVVMLLAVAIMEWLVYAPFTQSTVQRLAVEANTFSSTDSEVEIDIRHGPADGAIRLVAFPLTREPSEARDVMIFDDLGYPNANIGPTAAQGIYDHVSGELKVRKYRGLVAAVTATTLRDVLADTGLASQRIVVLMSGVLPSTVFSRAKDLVSPWVKAGGIVVWGGATIGYWSGTPGHLLGPANIVSEPGTERLLGKGVIQYPTRFGDQGTVPTDIASALDITYRYAGVGVLRVPVLARGGLTLGWYAGKFSSVSFLPVGLGGYLIFGGEIPDEAPVAVDLVRILMSGAIYGSGQVAYQDIDLSSLLSGSSIVWRLPFSFPKSGVEIAAFDPGPDAVFFSTQLLH